MRVCAWVISITAFLAPLSFVSAVRSPSQDMAAKIHRKSKVTVATLTATAKTTDKSVKTPTSLPGSTDCTSGLAMRQGLTSSVSPELMKLSQYEQVCRSAIATTMSFFVPTPKTLSQAKSDAADVAVQLKEFARFGVTPLVFFEPTADGALVDMASYRNGTYDAALDAYFSAIKTAGVTDAMMGTWVPIPEGNLPEWTSLAPADFTGCVTKAASFQKKYFPASKTSIMLDNESYPQSGSWDGGHVVSLVPYLQNIPAGLIDSFGLQGFPWSPPANEGGPTNGAPKDYLRSDLAIEAAKTLHVGEIWLNTGTFGVKYANQPGQVVVTPTKRLEQLNGVVAIANSIRSQGFKVSVHLFAENKSNVDEATDWSYWPSGNLAANPNIDVFKTFTHGLQANGIPLWLFDAI
jgi:hypothetical protein